MSTDLRHPADRDELHDIDGGTDTDTGAQPQQHGSDEPGSVEVRRDGPLALGVGLVATLVAAAYLNRAVESGSALDWLVCVVLGLVAGAHLVTALDARAPLMVIDPHGVRVRRGHTWQGVAWPEVDRVEHTPRETTMRDGRIAVVDQTGRELAVRLSLSTRLIGANWHELTAALVELSDGRTEVFEVVAAEVKAEVEAEVEAEVDAQVVQADHEDNDAVSDLEHHDAEPATDHAAAGSPEPVRKLVLGRRSETVHEYVVQPMIDAAHTDVVEDRSQDAITVVGISAASVTDHAETSTILIDGLDHVPAPAADPVIGRVLRDARTRVGLGVDQLAERTRIRPHVIEAVELDDFGPCGGDFYARGHLRTLARVLGVDVAPLLETYDERYADLPVDPRSVFEAELATSGRSGRGGRGRLNWSVLVAAVMAVVLMWSVARLVMDGPVEVTDHTVLNGSPGGKASLSSAQTKTPKVPVTFTAATGGTEVIVRDAKNEVVFAERLAFMQTAKVDVAPPVRISSTDGGLQVSIDGDDRGALGQTGQDAQNVFVVRK